MSDEIRQVASRIATTLDLHGVPDSQLEAEVLLRLALQYDRACFYASLSENLGSARQKRVDALVRRRISGEPLAYITGQREFYGLDFTVSPAVLVPRQETELLVDAALEFARQRSGDGISVADVGTGSGAIAVALAVNLRDAQVYATDCSKRALAVADRNKQVHGVADRVCLLRGDLLTPLSQPVDLILSNPPYIATSLMSGLPPEVQMEPRVALDGGEGGIEVIRRLFEQAPPKLKAGGCLMVEISPEQLDAVCGLAKAQFPDTDVSYANDLLGLPRCVIVSTK